MGRRRGGDETKPCNECGKTKPRIKGFGPRWGRCPEHKHLRPGWDPKCSECVRLRNHRTRQPRCYDCDEARQERLKIERSLKRLYADAGLAKADVRKKDASALEIEVLRLGLAEDPKRLLRDLRGIAGEKVSLDVRPFAREAKQLELLPPRSWSRALAGPRSTPPCSTCRRLLGLSPRADRRRWSATTTWANGLGRGISSSRW